jgi:glutamate-1-semialdehyde 2,1-aminomutase
MPEQIQPSSDRPHGDRVRFQEKTRRSGEVFRAGQEYLAAHSTSRYSLIYLDRGEGCYVYDVDGNRYIDFVNTHFFLPFGHNHPDVRRAILSQVEKGTLFQPNEVEVEHARLICERVPSIEKLRFTVSGTEATMLALRVARVHTGRPKVAKMLGGYHGVGDLLLTGSGVFTPQEAEDPYDPVASAGAGVLGKAVEDVVLLSFNNPEFCERAIEQHKHELAAVIVEPMLGTNGMIPARDGFLEFLRDITRRYGIILIFDEMITLGLGRGGAQEYYGVIPDMTTCGKIIGGGMPIGCVGGQEEIMAAFDGSKHSRPAWYAATHNGHPLSMVAGSAHLRALTNDVFERLHQTGESFRRALQSTFDGLGVAAQVTGIGQFFAWHLTAEPVYNYETARMPDLQTTLRIQASLTSQGIYQYLGRTIGAVSLPMTSEHLDAYLHAMEVALREKASRPSR